MNKSRLLKLAKFLDTVPKAKFDMGTWARSAKSARATPQCVTKACALGWATAIPEFAAAGLQLVAYCGNGRFGVVRYGAHQNFDAAEKFFGLPFSISDQIFGMGSNDPKEKAKEIRRIVRAK